MNKKSILKNKYVSKMACKIEPNTSRFLEIPIPSGFNYIKSIHLSSSGTGKYFIFKNEELIATLFDSIRNRNVEYKIPISLLPKDMIVLRFQNNETYHPMDMYSTIEFSRLLKDKL
jgi:hypothetical protein